MPDKTALILINFQIDFFAGGATGLDAGPELITKANTLMPQYDRVIGVRDWHPADHVSFAASHLWRRPGQVMRIGEREQLLWQMHCVQDSFGAEWAPGLQIERFDAVFNKGTNPATDGYSAFEGTELAAYLHAEEIAAIDLMGFTLQHDVRYTAQDAAENWAVKILDGL
ncbi:MAG TPA: isochorismatase family protein [Saprospiraceae bacterium]|nr:isochorismatase family protein [Saprospiraceae bacterium]HMP23910.1 isochorismatase family protein [Saprospiraceae bacterium]